MHFFLTRLGGNWQFRHWGGFIQVLFDLPNTILVGRRPGSYPDDLSRKKSHLKTTICLESCHLNTLLSLLRFADDFNSMTPRPRITLISASYSRTEIGKDVVHWWSEEYKFGFSYLYPDILA
ncbi:hypothetical protein GALMADRAFT_810532 [Galerina marginata CBS 339.88]|uniref:Uncharacterized protein n=1 Tax=Galerina marginata (strain CBS 339.88) TaxID=685588 RepID=A0A067SIS0_GALM3|nr:hypothetical protein GALMADRAFT_810532 [Galerina marginata CBS 339.88]